MSAKKRSLDNLSISLEKFDIIDRISKKIAYEDWVRAIEQSGLDFTWLEDTEKGKKTIANLDKFDDDYKQNIILSHSKRQVRLGYNVTNGSFDLQVNFNDECGLIIISSDYSISKRRLVQLKTLADSLSGMLLNYGQDIVDQSVIDQ